MELAEGEDIAERLKRGAIPADEAIAIARQIAEALEAAHEKGIVHRDLKPANVKLSPDGSRQGARLRPRQGLGQRRRRRARELRLVPLSHPRAHRDRRGPDPRHGRVHVPRAGARQAGGQASRHLVLRRAAVRDADGQAALRRRDGVGRARRRAHARAASGTSCRPRRRRPSGACCVSASSAIRRTACTTSPTRAWRSTRRFAGCRRKPRRRTSRSPRRSGGELCRGQSRALLALSCSPWSALAAGRGAARPVRLSVELGADMSLATTGFGVGTAAVLSPDGELLAFVAQRTAGGRPQQLYVRPLDQLAGVPASGHGERAATRSSRPTGSGSRSSPAASSRRWPSPAAPPSRCAMRPTTAAGPGSMTGRSSLRLRAERAVTGVRRRRERRKSLTTLDPAARRSRTAGRRRSRRPRLCSTRPTARSATSRARASSSSRCRAARGASFSGADTTAAISASGHLVYMHDGTLFAAPFDPDRLERDRPVRAGASRRHVRRGVRAGRSSPSRIGGRSHTCRAERRRGSVHSMAGPRGPPQPLRAEPRRYRNLRFSPDGRKLAMDIQEGRQLDVWIYEWRRDTLSRLTFDPGYEPAAGMDAGRPTASPSAPTERTRRRSNLYWQRADGTGDARAADRKQESRSSPTSWHPSGKFLAFTEQHPQTSNDVMILPLEGDATSGWRPGKPAAFLNSPAVESPVPFPRWPLARVPVQRGRRSRGLRPALPGPGRKMADLDRRGALRRAGHERGAGALLPDGRRAASGWRRTSSEGDSFRAERPREWSPGRILPLRDGDAGLRSAPGRTAASRCCGPRRRRARRRGPGGLRS